jgi:hypothetical protein
MKGIASTFIFAVLFLISPEFALGQELSLKKGAVVDGLTISDSIAESFAMYLPRNYSADKNWPIVFVFDNEGRGINTARLFSSAAEDQGYLIVASNNISKQDSVITNLKKASRLLENLLQNFPIDENRVYTAGLKEGALVASALPAVYPKIKGILVVEDIWINKDYLIQNDEKETIVVFADYKSDFYNEFEENSLLLKPLDYKSLTYYYEGTNTWPATKLISHGLGVFTLNAMLDGNEAIDPEIVNKLFQSEIATAESMRRQLNFYKAYELLELMQKKYKYFDKKREIRDLQKQIRRESLYKEQRSQFNAAKIKESNKRYEYRLLLEEDLSGKSFENVGWWSQQFKGIQDLQKSDNLAEVEIGYRLEDYLQTYAHKRFQELKMDKVGIDRLILISLLRTIFDKDNPEAYFSIISLSAQDGDYYTSLLYLEDLLKTGYDEFEELYDIPGTLDLRLSPEFNELVKKYLGKSKYYNIQLED